MRHRFVLALGLGVAACAPGTPGSTPAPADAPYRVLTRARVGGEGGTDYLFAGGDGRLYITRNAVRAVPATDSTPARDAVPGRITVFDLATLAPVGTVLNGGGNGAVVEGRTGHGFASSHPDLTMFDARTLQLIKRIDPDAATPQATPKFSGDGIYADPADGRVYVGSHPTRDLAVLDATDGRLVGRIPLGGVPEQTVSDGRGTLYVMLQDSVGGVAVVDQRALTVTRRLAIGDVGRCNGLALDAANGILFAACAQGRTPGQPPAPVMVILRAADGAILATLPLAGASDGAAFNPRTREAFSSHSNGTITVVKALGPTEFRVTQTIETMPGARTISLDERTGRLYVMSVERGAPPAGARPGQLGPPVPGSFTIVVVGR